MPGITRSHRVRLVLTLSCVAAVVVAGGCRRLRAKDAPVAEPAGELVRAPSVSRGLRIEVWAIEDRGGELARALQGYEEPAAFVGAGEAMRWRQSGLRLVGVPASELETLRGSLSLVAPVREESLIEARGWRPLARGPRLNGETVLTAGGPAPRDDGWARLLARAWASPRVVQGRETEARLRLELAPQIVEPSGGESIESIEARLRGRARSIGEDGPVLEDLMLSVAMREGEALLVVGEDPEADWSVLAQSEGEDPSDQEPTPEDPGVGPGAPDEVEPIDGVGMGVLERRAGRVAQRLPSGQPAGPGAPEYRTLGEAILVGRLGLSAEEARGGSVLLAGRRAVIVIVPQVSGPYRILPQSPAREVGTR